MEKIERKIGIESEINFKDITVEMYQQAVSKVTGISVKDMERKIRKEEIREARQLTYYFLINYKEISLASAGLLFKQDHSTVLHACKRIKELFLSDKKIQNQVQKIYNELWLAQKRYVVAQVVIERLTNEQKIELQSIDQVHDDNANFSAVCANWIKTPEDVHMSPFRTILPTDIDFNNESLLVKIVRV